MTTPSPDERKTLRLLFDREIANGSVHEADLLTTPEILAAVRTRRVPQLPVRVGQAYSRRSGRMDAVKATLDPIVHARRTALGDAAAGPPRFLLRMDEYPHWRARHTPDRYGDSAFAVWREILASAKCSYLTAVVPRVADDPMEATGDSRDLTETEVDRLRQLADDGVTFALHGYDHRTRFAHPRLHTELGGRSAAGLTTLLREALEVLRSHTGIEPKVLVPPFNTFGARQYRVLASMFRVVTGGPESILRMGYQPGPQWRGEAVYLPAYPPLYASAAEVLPAVERLIDQQVGTWVPIVLHWGWEADRGWKDLERLVEVVAPLATPWDEFLDAVETSR